MKDLAAIPFFVVIFLLLDDPRNIPFVKGLLFIGALADLVFSLSGLGLRELG